MPHQLPEPLHQRRNASGKPAIGLLAGTEGHHELGPPALVPSDGVSTPIRYWKLCGRNPGVSPDLGASAIG
jgi:hypothetical protein